MTEPSLRKPAGALLILLLVAVCVALFASLSDSIAQLSAPLQGVLYAVAGTAWIWILPMRPILRWMETGRWR